MFKAKQFSLIFLLSLLHSTKCIWYDINLENEVRRVSTDLDSCSVYFNYVRIDDFIHGNLTLPNMKIGDKVQMIFRTRFYYHCNTGFKGFLLPDGSSQEVIKRVRNGQSISYRVDFPMSDLPGLIKIFINDNELCATKVDPMVGKQIVLQHTLQTIRPDFTNNLNIPNVAEVRSCGLANTKVTIDGVSPLNYGLTQMNHGRHPWPSAIYERQASSTSAQTLCAESRNGSHSYEEKSDDILARNGNGCWMPKTVIAAGLIFQECSELSQQDTMYCDIAKHISKLERYIAHQEQPVIGSPEKICGISGTQSRNEHPWLVAVYRKFITGLYFHCSGILISPRSVLISASRFLYWDISQSYEFRVLPGRYNLSNFNEDGVVAREIETFIYHPTNRLVILQMKAPVSFTQNIKPICWGTEQTDRQLQILGQSATGIGWHYYLVCEKHIPQSEDVTILSAEQCRRDLYNGVHTLCINHPEEYNQNDFLILKRNGRWLLRGVFAGQPVTDFYLYTDIAENLLWIQNNTSP